MSRYVWVLLCVLCTVAATSSGNSDLTTVGDDRHLWILLPEEDEGSGWMLVHAGSRSGTQDYRIVRRFDEPPVAMSALGHTLWLVFPGSAQAASPRFELYRLQAEFQPSVDLYVMEPREGLDTLPPIQGIEQLLRCVGTADGPMVVGRRAVTGAESDALIGMRLQQGRWQPVELPDSISVTSDVLGVHTDRGLMLAQSSGGSLSTWRHDRDGNWLHQSIDGAADPVSLIDVDGQPLLARLDEAGMVHLAYLQDGGLWPLATLPAPAAPWGVVGLRGAANMVSEQDRRITLVGIDAMTGGISEPVLLEPMSVLGSGLWSIAIAVGLASAVILVIVLARGGDLSSMVVPAGWMVLPPLTRLGALCIDLVPGFCVFFLLADGDWRQLIRVPLMTLNSLDFGPYLLLVATTVLWCGGFEWFMGTSPGKMIVGASVRTTDGGRARLSAICVRNMMKGFVLLVPPLAVLTLLHPNQQGIGDLMARTLVVRKRPSVGPDQS